MNEGLELLRQLFCQHFGLVYEKYTGKESLRKLFKDRRLDFESFSAIFVSWLTMLSAVSEPCVSLFEESDESDKSMLESSMSSSECLKRLSLGKTSPCPNKIDIAIPESNSQQSYLSPNQLHVCQRSRGNKLAASHSSHHISAVTGETSSPAYIIRSTTSLTKSASYSQLSDRRPVNPVKAMTIQNGVDMNIEVV